MERVRFFYRGEGLYIADGKPWGKANNDYYPAADYEALEAKLAALVEAAGLKRNAIVINAEDFMQHLDGRWVAVPEEDFDQLRAAVAAAKGTP